MSTRFEKLSSKKITRRNFIAGATAVAASIAATGALSACSSGTSGSDTTTSQGDGTWISAACWHNCGGRCVNMVLMKDDAIVRQGSDTAHEDSFDWIQQRGCPRGRAQQQQCFGADRLKYPMKRKNWQPGGGDNAQGELRGKDEWERISWDDAIDLMASEMKRLYESDGAESILAGAFPAGPSLGTVPGVEQIMLAMGGHVTITDTSSCGVYSFNVSKLGLPGTDLGMTNDRYDLKNAETVLIMGGNSAWSSGGSTLRSFTQALESGTQFIMVSPSYNATAAWLNAKWIPVFPGTDTAFLLGVAYEMIQQNVYDQDFLDKYTVGFDANKMPADAILNENFKDYVLGTYDGIPKTANWASAICGCTADDISWLAGQIGKDHKAMLFHNYALARCANADNVPQLFMTVATMGGHAGKSGHAFGGAYKTFAGGTGAPALVKPGDYGIPEIENKVTDTISAPLVWQSLLDGQYNSTGMAYGNTFNAENIKQSKIKAVIFDAATGLQTTPDAFTGVEALRSMDFVASTAFSYNSQARYSDLVLPLTTEWERVGGFPGHQRSRETLIVYTKVTDPLYEAKTDQEIGTMLADNLGLNATEIWPESEEQAFFNGLAGAIYIDENGDEQTLISITQNDIDEWGCNGTPQEGVVDLKDFLAAGSYTIQRKEGDAYTQIGYADFIADPEKNPLKSTSGKFEIYCQYKADMLNSMGYSPAGTWKPYANYVAAPEGREGMYADREIGSGASEYPFIVYNPHYLRRAHQLLDNSPWLREAWTNPVFLNEDDATAKGITEGATVRVFNAHGAVLRQASLTQIIMPGCVGLPHGAWLDYDEEEGLDRAGTDNVLCGNVTGGMGTSGYNNYNCDYELYTGTALTPDAELPQRIVELA